MKKYFLLVLLVAPSILLAEDKPAALACEDHNDYLVQLVTALNSRVVQLEAQLQEADTRRDQAQTTQERIDALQKTALALTEKYKQPGCDILLNGTFRCAPGGRPEAPTGGAAPQTPSTAPAGKPEPTAPPPGGG